MENDSGTVAPAHMPDERHPGLTIRYDHEPWAVVLGGRLVTMDLGGHCLLEWQGVRRVGRVGLIRVLSEAMRAKREAKGLGWRLDHAIVKEARDVLMVCLWAAGATVDDLAEAGCWATGTAAKEVNLLLDEYGIARARGKGNARTFSRGLTPEFLGRYTIPR